jgi:hypothetical protein
MIKWMNEVHVSDICTEMMSVLGMNESQVSRTLSLDEGSFKLILGKCDPSRPTTLSSETQFDLRIIEACLFLLQSIFITERIPGILRREHQGWGSNPPLEDIVQGDIYAVTLWFAKAFADFEPT